MMDGKKQHRKSAATRHQHDEPVNLRRDDSELLLFALVAVDRGESEREGFRGAFACSGYLSHTCSSQLSWEEAPNSRRYVDCVESPAANALSIVSCFLGWQLQHPGNVRFYVVIDQFTDAYFNGQTKNEKSQAVQQVFKELSASARFLRQDSSSKRFYRISDTDARQKISHAIRYRRENGGSSIRSGCSTPAAMPSPVGETEGASFFSRDAQRPPSVRSTTPQAVDRPVALRLNTSCPTTNCPTTNCPTTKPRVPRQVVFELIPDDELEKALGNPQEYEVDGNESIFDWPEITSLSSLEFPEDRMNEGEGLGWAFFPFCFSSIKLTPIDHKSISPFARCFLITLTLQWCRWRIAPLLLLLLLQALHLVMVTEGWWVAMVEEVATLVGGLLLRLLLLVAPPPLQTMSHVTSNISNNSKKWPNKYSPS